MRGSILFRVDVFPAFLCIDIVVYVMSRVPCTTVLSQEIQIFQETFFVFCKFYFVILPTQSVNCILIFTALESSFKVLSNCVFLKLLI